MKRISVMFLVVGFVAAVAVIGVAVESVNVVGYATVTIPPYGDYNLVALNFDAINPVDANLQGVFGDQLRASVTPALADKIYIYDPSGLKYDTYARKSTDGEYHDVSNWAGAATNAPLAAGYGLWLQSPSTATQQLDIAIMGEVVAVSTQLVSLVASYQLLGYGFSCDTAINDTSLADGGTAHVTPALADQILIWNGTGYDTYGLKSTDNKWHSVSDWAGPATTDSIAAGKGFWYLARSGFTWSETNKYLSNL